MFHSTYMGVHIWRHEKPGYRLRWYTIGYGAADTLDGLRQLIKETL